MVNDSAGSKQYNFKIYPVLKEERDKRENKFSDISIIKIVNKRTKILIEIKLAVFPRLVMSDNVLDDFSQLFLEGLYVYEQEKISGEIMLVLTDAITWHIFIVNFNTKPVSILEFVTISSPSSQNPTNASGLKVKPVVSKLRHFISSTDPHIRL